jgi:hypothetical protein
MGFWIVLSYRVALEIFMPYDIHDVAWTPVDECLEFVRVESKLTFFYTTSKFEVVYSFPPSKTGF